MKLNFMRRVVGCIASAAVLTGVGAADAAAQAYFCEFYLYAAEPGVPVTVLEDPAAQQAAANAAEIPGLAVYPVTKGDISIGDTRVRMQGGLLSFVGSGADVLVLAEPSLALYAGEASRLVVGEIPAMERSCGGPATTPIYSDAIGYSVDVALSAGNTEELLKEEVTFNYYVPGARKAEEHTFVLNNVTRLYDWTAVVKRMPDGGHIILYHMVRPYNPATDGALE